jgi:pimeloyl-ACP methyl ester carboxylesterase
MLALIRRKWGVSLTLPPVTGPMPRPPVRHVIYLHGFASSPNSTKARRVGAELTARHVGYSCPDFNQPAFETLTVTRMLGQTAEAIAAAGPGPIALVGSSLGAFVAVHAAARDTTGSVDRLVLLAPAFDFGGNRLRHLGEHGVDEWRRRGTLAVFHYAWNEPREVGFALYEDAAGYDAFALGDPVPTLIIQGARDASVDPASVARWAATRAHVDLRMVDDEHQLTASMPGIWTETEAFLGLGPVKRRV